MAVTTHPVYVIAESVNIPFTANASLIGKPEPDPIKKVAPQLSVHTGNCEQYRSLFAQYDWNVETALAVCSEESKGNARALNNNPRTGDYSVGLMQVNMLWHYDHTEEELKNPSTNIAKAYQIWQERGFRPWSVCRTKVVCY